MIVYFLRVSHSRKFSKCSILEYRDFLLRGGGACLFNRPTKVSNLESVLISPFFFFFNFNSGNMPNVRYLFWKAVFFPIRLMFSYKRLYRVEKWVLFQWMTRPQLHCFETLVFQCWLYLLSVLPYKKQTDNPSIKISWSSHVRVFILLPRDSELD